MNFVEPIRDKAIIEDIYLDLDKTNKRDALMFMLGLHTGLRISDILKFKIRDLMKDYYNIREQKTGKQKSYEWNPYLKRIIDEYIQGKDADEYVFRSRQTLKPITRQRAYQIIKGICEKHGVHNVGTHTLRKTFGYFLYQESGKDVALVMDILNHSNQETTLRYIGITQLRNNKKMQELKYFNIKK